jgi:hypothetical protein
VPTSVAEDARRADAVFVASVVQDLGEYVYEVRASDIYKGSPGGFPTVRTATSGIAGGIDLRPDRQYILFVTRDGQSWVSPGCSGTVELSARAIGQVERVLGPATPLRVTATPDSGPSESPSATPDSGTGPRTAEPVEEDGLSTWALVGIGVALLAGTGGVVLATRRERKR